MDMALHPVLHFSSPLHCSIPSFQSTEFTFLLLWPSQLIANYVSSTMKHLNSMHISILPRFYYILAPRYHSLLKFGNIVYTYVHTEIMTSV